MFISHNSLSSLEYLVLLYKHIVFFCLHLSIGDSVLYKKGFDGDTSNLKFLSNFRKRKEKCFFQLDLYATF